ncbi:hypothetical protein IFM89_035900 [Coptis chinensis]|uniref:Uncharacterized protein n=1 Tax=Coptis chinensis TaxID=261450 RepID=A0A835H2I4_9MAGN|nr:hypothetical protein IFM89_035900 [Coptis chinensis]
MTLGERGHALIIHYGMVAHLADFIMPFFLFIVGVAIALALKDLDGDIFDDDGRVKRTGTLLTASAHIITAVIGSERIQKVGDTVKKIIIRTIKLLLWGIILQGGYSHAPDDLSYGIDMKQIHWRGILQIRNKLRRQYEFVVSVKFRDVRINVPTAPEVGLYLEECFFPSYNQKWKDTHEEISMEAYVEQAEDFKMKQVYSHIASMEQKEGSVAVWLHSLNLRNYPDLHFVEDNETCTIGENVQVESIGGKELAALFPLDPANPKHQLQLKIPLIESYISISV